MSKRKEKYHGYSKRKHDTREPKQRFLIVCEREKTEPNYFRSFRVPRNVIEVNVEGVGENPSRLVATAKELNDKEDEKYDQVWCVFDRDSWTPQDFNTAIKMAYEKGFKVAYSNEAFELWYVLHFEFFNTCIPRSDYCKKLNRPPIGKYQKNSEEIYAQLFELQNTAIKNAKQLLKSYKRPNPSQDNPSTTVHLLVEELNKFIV